MDITIDKRFKLDLIAARDPGRYAMHGVLVEDTGEFTARAVATDGRMLVVLDNLAKTGNGVARAIIPTIAWKFARNLKGIAKNRDGLVTVDSVDRSTGALKDLRVEVNCSPGDGTSMRENAIEGEFPRFQAVVPTREDVHYRIAFNPYYLAEIADAIGVSKELPCVTIECKGPTHPIRVIGPSDNAFGVLMPVTVDGQDLPKVPDPIMQDYKLRSIKGWVEEWRASRCTENEAIRNIERVLAE